MQDLIIEYVYLILIILGLVMLANKARIAYPIVVVVGGLLLSLTSGFSHIIIDPDLVFFIFLPPLLYEAAWQVSWKEFWKWRRIIVSFAFPIVILSSCVIAVVSHTIIPGFTLALGFLLGGIISPPDAVSSTTIMRQIDVPKRLTTVVEGESLLNDASSLVVFRFALAAVLTSQFHLKEALTSFIIVICMGALIGVLVGLLFYAVHRWMPTTTSIEIVLTFLTPYCMYYFAEHFHFSGVLAVVSGGLFLSSRRLKLLSFQSRLQGVNFWSNVIFILNGLIFLLMGLQLPSIIQQLGNTSLTKAIEYGLIISFILIVTRLTCTLAASPFTWLMSHFIKVADPRLQWRLPLIFGWAGMRGVVSLAAALSIPLLVADGVTFPHRNLILFITFVVIMVTLVFQGLTLPWLIRKLNVTEEDMSSKEEQEESLQKKVALFSMDWIEKKHGEDLIKNNLLKNQFDRLKMDMLFLNQSTEDFSKGALLKDFQQINLELLRQQRELLNQMNQSYEYDEELIRKYISLIDLEEYKFREKQIPLI